MSRCCVPQGKSIRFLSNHIERAKMPTCETCAYFLDGPGRCRRHPPTVFAAPDPRGSYTHWPEVRKSDWCGEFNEKVPPHLNTSAVRTLKNPAGRTSMQCGEF